MVLHKVIWHGAWLCCVHKRCWDGSSFVGRPVSSSQQHQYACRANHTFKIKIYNLFYFKSTKNKWLNNSPWNQYLKSLLQKRDLTQEISDGVCHGLGRSVVGGGLDAHHKLVFQRVGHLVARKQHLGVLQQLSANGKPQSKNVTMDKCLLLQRFVEVIKRWVRVQAG